MDPIEITSAFDARAARYAQDDWHRRYAEAFVAAVPLRVGDLVLDAGTGTGFAAFAVARRVGENGRVLGVDLSAGMLEYARASVTRERLHNVDLLQADVTDLRSIESGTFDAVVCAAGLLYMPVLKALTEWHRLLKPRGLVAFSTMRAGSPSAGRLFRQCAAEFGVTVADRSEPLGTEERCRRTLEDAGFNDIEVIAAEVPFETIDLAAAWEASFRSMGQAAIRTLGAERQEALRTRYLAALADAIRADLAATSRAEVLFAMGRSASPDTRAAGSSPVPPSAR